MLLELRAGSPNTEDLVDARSRRAASRSARMRPPGAAKMQLTSGRSATSGSCRDGNRALAQSREAHEPGAGDQRHGECHLRRHQAAAPALGGVPRWPHAPAVNAPVSRRWSEGRRRARSGAVRPATASENPSMTRSTRTWSSQVRRSEPRGPDAPPGEHRAQQRTQGGPSLHQTSAPTAGDRHPRHALNDERSRSRPRESSWRCWTQVMRSTSPTAPSGAKMSPASPTSATTSPARPPGLASGVRPDRRRDLISRSARLT
jgi:hypothetical protein